MFGVVCVGCLLQATTHCGGGERSAGALQRGRDPADTFACTGTAPETVIRFWIRVIGDHLDPDPDPH